MSYTVPAADDDLVAYGTSGAGWPGGITSLDVPFPRAQGGLDGRNEPIRGNIQDHDPFVSADLYRAVNLAVPTVRKASRGGMSRLGGGFIPEPIKCGGRKIRKRFVHVSMRKGEKRLSSCYPKCGYAVARRIQEEICWRRFAAH